jgi:hypothetical protein
MQKFFGLIGWQKRADRREQPCEAEDQAPPRIDRPGECRKVSGDSWRKDNQTYSWRQHSATAETRQVIEWVNANRWGCGESETRRAPTQPAY